MIPQIFAWWKLIFSHQQYQHGRSSHYAQHLIVERPKHVEFYIQRIVLSIQNVVLMEVHTLDPRYTNEITQINIAFRKCKRLQGKLTLNNTFVSITWVDRSKIVSASLLFFGYLIILLSPGLNLKILSGILKSSIFCVCFSCFSLNLVSITQWRTYQGPVKLYYLSQFPYLDLAQFCVPSNLSHSYKSIRTGITLNDFSYISVQSLFFKFNFIHQED